MEAPSYIALAQQAALWRQTEVIANNLANISTPGFKADRIIFAEYLQSTGGSESSSADAPLSFVREVGAVRDLRDGMMTPTGNAFDLAIQGTGYFAVETPGGPRYTRQGTFHLDGQGRVVTSDGYAVLDAQSQPITMRNGESRFEVSPEGQITTESGTLARIQLVQFDDEQSMRKVGANLYETDAPSQPVDPKKTAVRQGAIEASNVQSIVEVTSLIEISRRYQMAQNILNAENELQVKAIQQLGRVV
jgi:flagellar basal-body rod protein FlgF